MTAFAALPSATATKLSTIQETEIAQSRISDWRAGFRHEWLCLTYWPTCCQKPLSKRRATRKAFVGIRFGKVCYLGWVGPRLSSRNLAAARVSKYGTKPARP